MPLPPAHTLRPATAEDIETLYALHRTTMRAYVEATYGVPWDEPTQRALYWDRWSRIQADGRMKRTLDVVLVADEIAGYLDVEQEDGFVALNNIRIAPQHQRQGLGAALVYRVIEAAAPLPVELAVLRVNPAQRLYARLGFEVIAETDTHYRMRYNRSAS